MFARPVGWVSVVVAGGLGVQMVMGLAGVHPTTLETAEPNSVANLIRVKLGSPITTAQDDAPSTDYGPALDGSMVEGEFKCVDCHRTEFEAWQGSAHYQKGFQTLRTGVEDDLKDYAEGVGLEFSQITKQGACIQCHGTPYENEWSNATLLTSVTCEACHNPSGGDQGWLNIHASYGANGLPRTSESLGHFQMRADRCAKAGQIRSSDIYAMIKRCAECHVPMDEGLYNAGHEQGKISFTVDSLVGGIRHNFHMDSEINAPVSSLWLNPTFAGEGQNRTADGRLRLYSVLMPMVLAEHSMNNLASLEEPDSDFAADGVSRLENAAEGLGEAMEEIAEDAYSDLFDKLEEVLDKEIEVLDEDPEDRADYVEELAELVAELEELEADEDAATISKMWAIYKATFSWYYHFDNASVEDMYDMDYEESGLDYSQEAAVEAAKQLSMQIEVFVIENEDGSALEALEVPDVE